MSVTAFPRLPEHARLYIFGSSRPFTPADQPALQRELDLFVGAWKAHGEPVSGAWEMVYDRFLLVAVDEEQTALSGCSIDSLTRTVKSLESALGLSLLEGGVVYYRAEDGIRRAGRDEFRRLAEAGTVNQATRVFDNTLTTLRALRSGAWEVPAGTSWHARAFPLGLGSPGPDSTGSHPLSPEAKGRAASPSPLAPS